MTMFTTQISYGSGEQKQYANGYSLSYNATQGDPTS